MRPGYSVVSATDSGAMVITPTSGGGGANCAGWRPQPDSASNAAETIIPQTTVARGFHVNFRRSVKFMFVVLVASTGSGVKMI